MDFDWGFFGDALFHPSEAFLVGLWRTVYISVLAQAAGTVLGLFVALARRSRLLVLRRVAAGWVWLIRGTPLLVQLVLVYNGLAATGIYRFEDARIGPFVVLGVVQAAVITLALNESAYMAEIIRAALDSLDVGQDEAAKALGMTPAQSMRLVQLPQALRVVVPPLGNEFNLMMKSTSLLSVIGVQEMFLTAQAINSATFKTFEIFLVAAAYYLLLTTLWGFVQTWLERRVGLDAPTSTPGSRWVSRVTTWRRTPVPAGAAVALPDSPVVPASSSTRPTTPTAAEARS